MPNLQSRLERLEAHIQAPEPNELSSLSDYDLLARICETLGGDVSALSHSAEEAYSKGFSCWAEELAAIVGVDLAELKAAMRERMSERFTSGVTS